MKNKPTGRPADERVTITETVTTMAYQPVPDAMFVTHDDLRRAAEAMYKAILRESERALETAFYGHPVTGIVDLEPGEYWEIIERPAIRAWWGPLAIVPASGSREQPTPANKPAPPPRATTGQ